MRGDEEDAGEEGEENADSAEGLHCFAADEGRPECCNGGNRGEDFEEVDVAR